MIIARTLTLLIGLSGLVWGMITFPVFWKEAPIIRTASAIANEEPFQTVALERMLATAERHDDNDTVCHAEASHAEVLVRLRLLEVTSDDAEGLETKQLNLRDRVRRSLSCSPTDSVLWLTLFVLSERIEGPLPGQLKFLQMSYETGPNEGWIARKRNYIAVARFERLPADLADKVLHEFSRMVESSLYEDALTVLTGPGWPIRERLWSKLSHIKARQRQDFEKALQQRGYDAIVPNGR